MPSNVSHSGAARKRPFVATTGTIVLVYWLLYRYIRKRVVGVQ